jgi:hypothetical protein
MKDLKKFIATTIREYLNEQYFYVIKENNQYNNLVTLNQIDEIRSKNNDLDKILRNGIFKNKGIYLKGGVARLALSVYYGFNDDSVIRDVDYCFIGDYEEYLKIEDSINLDIDYEGATINEYFKNRDVTLNEVLLRPNILIFTRRAYRDFEKNIINPKANVVSSRLASRLLLFSARYDYNIPLSINIEVNEMYSFDFLVCLLKAYELGVQQKYYHICREYGITDDSSLSEWLVFLLEDVYNFSLFGREKYIAYDISTLINIRKELYVMYPELKKEIQKINMDDDYYLNYLKKKNRINKTKRL